MHQHPRPSVAAAASPTSPRAHSFLPSTGRDAMQRAPSDTGRSNDGDDGSEDGGVMAAAGPSKDAQKKLDQIIQNFHTKAAIVVLQSRMPLPIVFGPDGSKKVNRWFQIETDDTLAFREDLSLWRTCNATTKRPPPLVIDVYIDLSQLHSSQSLVTTDELGKRWNISEYLGYHGRARGAVSDPADNVEIILERWTIALKSSHAERLGDFGATLPTVYKKCIVFFRSLYTAAKFVPTWKFVKNTAKSGSPLKISCRVRRGEPGPGAPDALTRAVYDSAEPVTTICDLGITETPAGYFAANVVYRNHCDFQIADSETVLGSTLMGVDEDYFKPSLGARHFQRRRNTKEFEPGSLPAHRHAFDASESGQAYGSLSTFHNDHPNRAPSPISALRAAKNMGSDTGSPPRTSALQVPLQASRAGLGMPVVRRPSVSFQPFKAGSLSSSPGLMGMPSAAELLSPNSPQSLPRTVGVNPLTQPRNRSSLTAGMPASLRGGPQPDLATQYSASSSPKPAPITRYSSSFSHRRARLSFGGGSSSKVMDEDQNSSGKQSISSSTQPESGVLAAEGGGTGGSSGSLQTDDGNISDFLKLLDSKKNLKSFERNNEGATKRTSAQLSRFQSLRDTHNALTESMSSSAVLQRSSSSSSRQLSSVPPMVAATSISASSSPGKPVSPHTPHTPAIPSRLSAGSIAEYNPPRERLAPLEDVADDEATHERATSAIDIPQSPQSRHHYLHVRRSSSVAQQDRSVALDEALADLPYGAQRSISLGTEDREAPSLSTLLGLAMADDSQPATSPPNRGSASILRPAPTISRSRPTKSSSTSTGVPIASSYTQRPSSNTSRSYQTRLGSFRGRGATPPLGGVVEDMNSPGRGSTSGSDRGRRYSFSRSNPVAAVSAPLDYDDDLLFNMSEIGRERRSIDEGRGAGESAGSDRRSDSRNRRGW